jgi:outer membrane lipoprotein-sorting protein
MKYGKIFLILLVAFTFGCAETVTQGRKIDEAKVKDLMVSYNTTDKLIEAFGKPDKVEKLPSGAEQYTYRYYFRNPHWWTIDDVQEQNLKVVVKDNEVQSYNFTKGSTEKITKE